MPREPLTAETTADPSILGFIRARKPVPPDYLGNYLDLSPFAVTPAEIPVNPSGVFLLEANAPWTLAQTLQAIHTRLRDSQHECIFILPVSDNHHWVSLTIHVKGKEIQGIHIFEPLGHISGITEGLRQQLTAQQLKHDIHHGNQIDGVSCLAHVIQDATHYVAPGALPDALQGLPAHPNPREGLIDALAVVISDATTTLAGAAINPRYQLAAACQEEHVDQPPHPTPVDAATVASANTAPANPRKSSYTALHRLLLGANETQAIFNCLSSLKGDERSAQINYDALLAAKLANNPSLSIDQANRQLRRAVASNARANTDIDKDVSAAYSSGPKP